MFTSISRKLSPKAQLTNFPFPPTPQCPASSPPLAPPLLHGRASHAGPCSPFAESRRREPRSRTSFPRDPRDGGRKARRSNGRFRLNVSAELWAGEEGAWRCLCRPRHCRLGLKCRRGCRAAGRIGHENLRRATGLGCGHVWPLAELGGRGPRQVLPQHPLLGPPEVSVRGARRGGRTDAQTRWAPRCEADRVAVGGYCACYARGFGVRA